MTIQQHIQAQLEDLLSPSFLEVVNESHQHSVPPDSETHFKVVAVSDRFDGQRRVARHQLIYAALADMLAGPVHALALHTYTPAEWQVRQQQSPASPECRGGSKSG